MSSVAANLSRARIMSMFWQNLSDLRKQTTHIGAPRSESQIIVDGLMPILMKLSQQDDGQAQYYMACYLLLTNNQMAASHWLQQSAENNYPDACLKLAQQYLSEMDFNRAEVYFLKLVKTGDSFLIDQMKQSLKAEAVFDKMPKLQSAVSTPQHNIGRFKTSLSSYVSSLTNSSQAPTLFSVQPRAVEPENQQQDLDVSCAR